MNDITATALEAIVFGKESKLDLDMQRSSDHGSEFKNKNNNLCDYDLINNHVQLPDTNYEDNCPEDESGVNREPIQHDMRYKGNQAEKNVRQVMEELCEMNLLVFT